VNTLIVDTIVAQATPPGRGGIAIVRVSGPQAYAIAAKILPQVPAPRFAAYTEFLDVENQAIDQGLALYFPAPHSFTGEDVLELHGHGGIAVADMLMQTIIAHGARCARPGEFSERAFLNDKMDLAQAEAIADLIDATSTQAARSALKSLQGEFSARITQMVEALIHLRMYVEAAIDFAEEEIDFLADQQVTDKLEAVLADLQAVQLSAAQGSLLREGITVVIAGAPNVGKSSLLNCLSGKESAIVTNVPGTTRDVLREHINLDGMPLHIIDTAGLRNSPDVVEQEGMRRAQHEIAQADIVLLMCDATLNQMVPDIALENISANAAVIMLRNKIDLTKEAPGLITENGVTTISLSAKSGNGIELLKNYIKNSVGFAANTEGCFSARRRHLTALAQAQQFLQQAVLHLTERRGELLAEELRLAQQALSEISGTFTADDLLGRIFSSFCVGK
jgi:tRNA modification GTPase